ncbi:SRPBCC family protein [Bryobacter aggregatus]|uniref:SRPBCC family protein n=1 Tax=Bryobacter aggregatus TaxID=360054 RepID=UPI0004E0DB9C|nr:SRPBCC family protein [Bryobacter aggregatus]
MSNSTQAPPAGNRELQLTRLIPATPEKVFRAWTEPELLKQWFAPLPYTTPHAEIDLRPGGSSFIIMKSPEGVELPNRGVYLEVVPNRRIVATDAYTSAWEPSQKPFITLILSFEPEGEHTRYTARVLHWSVEDCEAHEKMGFHQGWGQATDQLEAVVAKL